MVTLQEILDQVSMRYPHSYTESQVISIVNEIQKRIFRTMYKPETATTYDIIADNPFYPVTFSPENIIDVVVNGEEYPFQNIKYDSQCVYYYISDDNTIGIYPTPTEAVTNGMTVFHYKEPDALTSVSNTPELDPVWHMMLVYHACRELAAIARDDMVNTFISEINELDRQFYRSRQARPHRIHDVYGVGRGAI